VVPEEKLEHDKCYFVVGREDETTVQRKKVEEQRKKDIEKHVIIQKFRIITDATEEDAVFYLDMAADASTATAPSLLLEVCH
jgi:hypothetical protein